MELQYKIDMTPTSRWIIPSPGNGDSEALFVQEIGDFDAGGSYYTEREGLSSYLLKYTLEGKGVLSYEGESFTLSPGQFFLIDCRAHQRYYTESSNGRWHVLWVHFSGSAAARLYARFRVVAGKPVASATADSSLPQLLGALLGLCERASTPTAALRADALLGTILAECIEAADAASSPRSSYVRLAKDYLTAHVSEKVTLEMLGSAANVNPCYLQKLFHRQLGTTPSEYLTSLRIAHAKELLRQTDEPLSVIAEQVGFSSAGHLIRHFERAENMTPGAYRRLWKEKNK